MSAAKTSGRLVGDGHFFQLAEITSAPKDNIAQDEDQKYIFTKITLYGIIFIKK